MDSGNGIHALCRRGLTLWKIAVSDKGNGHNKICLSIEHGFWKRNVCTVSPRVNVMKIAVSDKVSGHIEMCLSIEHGFWKRNTCIVSPRVML